MKRATWLKAFWTLASALACAFVLTQLTGCGTGLGAGQVAPPTPSPVPNSVPAAQATSGPNLPQPVISVVPPANSATAIEEATAVAQRTATALADSASAAATVTAIAEYAPTYAAQRTVQAATEVALMHPTPQSARVERGKAYPFVLYTHCGVDYATDFDGSFWDAVEKNYLPASLGNPAQRGTMTLTDDDHATFTFGGGSILFTRHLGPNVLPGLCV
jgi:hypothetical protein